MVLASSSRKARRGEVLLVGQPHEVTADDACRLGLSFPVVGADLPIEYSALDVLLEEAHASSRAVVVARSSHS